MSEPIRLCPICQTQLVANATYCHNCGQVQPRPDGVSQPVTHRWVGERRQVSVLFADLASFTAASEKADPEDVVDMLNTLFTRLMAECDREGGYLDKTVGDEMMVLFGAPKAHEDDPARAVRAALAMQNAMKDLAQMMREKVGRLCKINIGINTGPVVWGELGPTGRTAPTVIGDTVNLAARLEQYATNGQIVISDTVYQRVRNLFEFEILEPIQVKGKSGFIPIYQPTQAIEQKPAQIQKPKITLPLIGREKELDTLHAYWSRAGAGYPQIVMLKGDAGQGKSHLLAQFVDTINAYSANKQPLLLHVRRELSPGDTYRPMATLLQLFFGLVSNDTSIIRRRKIEDRAQVLGITGSKFLPLIGYLLGWYQEDPRLASAGQEEKIIDHLHVAAIDTAVDLFFKQSTRRPTLIVMDDLQSADAGTAEWLGRLIIAGQMIRHEPSNYHLMVLGATRPQIDAPIAAIQTQNTMILPPLDDTSRRTLLEHLLPGGGLPPSLITRLCTESEGNPFYLVEVTRGLVQSGQLTRSEGGRWNLTRPVEQIEIPNSVEGLILAKIDTLDPTTRMVLQHASVIGHTFNYQILSAISPVQNLDQALNNLKQRGFIKELTDSDIPGAYTFTQVVIKEVTYNNILRKTRRELHQKIAELTEVKTVSEAENIESLAHHYAAGGNQEKMIVYNWLAGRHALEHFQFEVSYQHLQLAWDGLMELPNPDAEIYQNIAHTLGDAGTFTGHFTQAATCYQTAWSLAGNQPEKRATLHYKLGRLSLYQDDTATAHENYRHALRLSAGDPGLTAQIEAELRLLFDLS